MTEDAKPTPAHKDDRPVRLLALWLFGDLIFAILPLLVLAAITALLGQSFAGFLGLKEWSFASIVLFGVVIRKFVRLKVGAQQTPLSVKLYIGLQFFIVMLIATVLVLSLVVLTEEGVLPGDNLGVLGVAQLFLFVTAAGTLAVAVAKEDEDLLWAAARKKGASRLWLLRRISFELGQAEETLQHVLDAVDRIASGPIAASAAASATRHQEERQSEVVSALLDRLEGLVADARNALKPAPLASGG